MDTLRPFDWLHYHCVKHARMAVVLLTPLFGMRGTVAVDNKMAFFSDALGHSALTGIAIGRGTNFLYDLWNKLKEWQTGKLEE